LLIYSFIFYTKENLMKKKSFTLVGIIFMLAFSQTSISQAQTTASVAPSMAASASPMAKMTTTKMTTTKMAAKMSASEILSIISTVDMDEIDAAKKALTKKPAKDVKSYAQMMHTEHNLNLQKTKNLAKTLKAANVQTKTVIKIHTDDAAQLTKILKLSGNAFDKAYINMMVNGHKKVLNMIKTQLMPSATNASLKKHLTETQASVTKHLNMATKLQAQLK
jgi:putative membrane protein